MIKIQKTIAANPRRSIFEKCFKFCFDSGFRIYLQICEDSPKNRWFSFIQRRVMTETSFAQNFGPNVVYFVVVNVNENVNVNVNVNENVNENVNATYRCVPIMGFGSKISQCSDNRVSGRQKYRSVVIIEFQKTAFAIQQFVYDIGIVIGCLLYTSPSPRDKRQSRMPSSA